MPISSPNLNNIHKIRKEGKKWVNDKNNLQRQRDFIGETYLHNDRNLSMLFNIIFLAPKPLPGINESQ